MSAVWAGQDDMSLQLVKDVNMQWNVKQFWQAEFAVAADNKCVWYKNHITGWSNVQAMQKATMFFSWSFESEMMCDWNLKYVFAQNKKV